jgi:hypothetical protein
MGDQVAADPEFLRAWAHLVASWNTEIKAGERPDCAAGLMKCAAKQHALGMGLLLDGLDEPVR